MSTIQSFNQMTSIHYDQRSMRQQMPSLPFYPSQSSCTGASYPFTVNGHYASNSAIDGLRQRLFRRQQKPPEYRQVKVKRTEWMTVNMIKTASVLNQPSQRSPPVNPSYSQPMYQPYVGPLVRLSINFLRKQNMSFLFSMHLLFNLIVHGNLHIHCHYHHHYLLPSHLVLQIISNLMLILRLYFLSFQTGNHCNRYYQLILLSFKHP